jgi:dipeptidyl aminopeptidase/acylaminoacyl peptidase
VTRRVAAAPPSSRRQEVTAPAPGLVGPSLAAVVLVVVAMVTLGLFTGRIPILPTPGGPGDQPNGVPQSAGPGDPGDPGDDPDATVAPSNVIVVPSIDPRTEVPGSIVYAKQGNIWVQTGTNARQITDTGRDSMPSWAPDGSWIYFVETIEDRGLFPSGGAARHYTLTYPVITRVKPDGTGREAILSGVYHSGPNNSWKWFYWLRQPVVSPDGKTLAVLSDAPQPSRMDVVVQFYDLATKQLTRPNIPEEPPLGHQDAAWRPDGKLLAFVRNGRDGVRGRPRIFLYNPASKRTVPLTAAGYTSPSWSPDGKYIAATRTTTLGTDVVILNGSTGAEVLRLTTDGRSWGPTWSPNGDAIAFLHLSFQIVDLRMVKLEGKAPAFRRGELLDLTENSGLDGASKPGWFVARPRVSPASPAPASGSPRATGG